MDYLTTMMMRASKGNKNNFDLLLAKLALSSSLSEQKLAAKEFRILTKDVPSFCEHITDSPEKVAQLLAPLASGTPYSDPDLQEDLITTVRNLSLATVNRKLLAESNVAMPLILDSLRAGNTATKRNAAATLLTLSLDANKATIGNAGALKPLINLFEEGDPSTMMIASRAIFKLCQNYENKGRAVNDGAVEVIFKKLICGMCMDVEELLETLVLLSQHRLAIQKISELGGALRYLLDTIRESSSGNSKEHAVTILYLICFYDKTKLEEVREDENTNGSISQLTLGASAKAVKKAYNILEMLRSFAVSPTHTA